MSIVQKEFKKAVNEQWKEKPPLERYQKKLIADLVVLEAEKEKAIDFPQYEKLNDEKNLYSMRHPEAKKNVRVIYTIFNKSLIILLTAFLENNKSDYKNAIKVAKTRLKNLEKN